MVSAEQLKSAYWKGFSAGIGTFHNVEEEEIIATLTDGVLYIQKAPAILNNGVLEVCPSG